MELRQYFENGNIAFYGHRGALPDFARKPRAGRMRVYRVPREKVGEDSALRIDTLGEVREEHADVYFLDRSAVKVLFVDFPPSARYVLVRMVPRFSWIIGVPGLIRRALIGLVRIEGVIDLPSEGKTQQWLVLKHQLRQSLHTRMSLSESVGIERFLAHIRAEKIRYVVLRFYEKLPQLFRDGGDLDILVADEDEVRLKEYLQSHPGSIGIDVWTPSRSSHNSITYYPPPLARKIIESAVDGPACSRIPSPREAFLSLAYHALYHKGFFAGVPSEKFPNEVNPHPQNDYAACISRLATENGIDVAITMEALDEYLHSEGWRPKLDTLAKIAPRNAWVWKYFFASAPVNEVGLGVIILKQKALQSGLAEDIMTAVTSHAGFTLIRKKIFNEEEVAYVREHLRGGVWNDTNNVRDYLPAIALVVLDTTVARAALLNIMHASPDARIRSLKRELRTSFDTDKVSLIHATDNTHEAWEYVQWCFPKETDDVRAEIERVRSAIQLTFFEKAVLRLTFLPRQFVFNITRFRQKVRGRLIRFLMT